MKFEDKYTTAERKQKDADKEKDKTEVSNDAFAVGDIIQALKTKIDNIKISLIK